MTRSTKIPTTRRDVLKAGAALGGSLFVPAGFAQTPARPQKMVTWTHMMGSAIDIGAAFLWVGKELGYFAEEGIDLQVQGSQGNAQAIQLLSAERVDSTSPAPDAILASAARGQSAPVKAVYLYVPRLHYVPAVLDNSAIRQATDLKGRKVGVLSQAHAGVNYIKSYVKEAGLDGDKDLEILAVGQGLQAAEALQSGKVDALAHWDVTYRAMEDNGYKLRYLPQSKLGTQMFALSLTVHEKSIRDRHAETQGWLRAVNKTIVFTLENPEAAAHLHYKMFPETKATGKSYDQIIKEGTSILRARAPQMVPANERMRGEFAASGWSAWARFLDLDGKIKDVSPFYTNEFIATANRFDLDALKRSARSYKA